MRRNIFVVGVVVVLVVGDVYIDQNNRNDRTNLSIGNFNLSYHKIRHHHGDNLERLTRCRRYAYNYNHQNNYMQKGRYYYSPSRCQQPYCVYCPRSSCRRRCPSITLPFPITTSRPPTLPIRICGCHPEGSQFPTCDVNTGKCICKPHYIGRKCDRCEDGYWTNSISDCTSCMCDINGSTSQICDQETGICACKVGVGGQRCDACLPNYYGNIISGCKECEPCHKEGHICHPETGKCVCPPLTFGLKCEKCTTNAWGYEPGIGCKACECSQIGSSLLQCDYLSGRCTCKIGFEGEKCDRCSFGYYGNNTCQKCNCDPAGTAPEECMHGNCRCSDQGECRCKANVQGKRCNICKDGTFGIELDNPLGCSDCFCFGRTKICESSLLTWDQIRTDEVVQNNDICIRQSPCWNLPVKFNGDLTLSYGGYLRISSNSAFAFSYLAFITGNGVTLESLINDPDIKMTEKNWKYAFEVNYPQKMPNDCQYRLDRACFMTVLQNVTNIQIVPGPTFQATEFNEILLDKATDVPGSLQALTVEKCNCPSEYTSLSCQDPNSGYYRYIPTYDETDDFIDKIVGVAKHCHCNDRSSECDRNTGHCINCSDNTIGPYCEFCSEGFYMDHLGNCSPCLCPSETQNFAKSCVTGKKPNQFICKCRSGYSGSKCNKCEDSYFGNPLNGGFCQLCNCNPYGSESAICDKLTGVCQCKPGFTGGQCAQCTSPRQVIQNGICAPCDECTQILFNAIDDLEMNLNESLDLFKGSLGPPWRSFNKTLNRFKFLSGKFNDNLGKADNLINKANLPELKQGVEKMENDLKKKNQTINQHLKTVEEIQKDSINISVEVKLIDNKIRNIITNLDNFGKSHISTKDALLQAKKILANIDKISVKIDSYDKYKDVYKRCKKIRKEVNKIYNKIGTNPDKLKASLNELKRQLGDLNLILDKTDVMNKMTKIKNKQNFNRIANLNVTINKVHAKNYIVNSEFTEIIQKLNATSDILKEVDQIYRILSDKDISDFTRKVESKLEVNAKPEHFELVSAVRKHVKDLENKIDTYKSLFNFTNDEWKKINASGAYENLIKGIEEAYNNANAAKTTLEEALKLIFPEYDDSLPDKTNLALALSDRLKQRIINLGNRNSEFRTIREDLEKLKYSILKNGKDNNDLTTILRNLLGQIDKQSSNTENLEKVKEDAWNVSDRMAKIEQEAKNINITTQYELMKLYWKYLNLTTSEEVKKLMDQVILTRFELQKISVNFTNIDRIKNVNDVKFQNGKMNLKSIEEKIRDLKNKIQFAKQTADSINIAMSISNCRRYYKTQNDVFKSLSITFKCRSCSLFNLTNPLGHSISIQVKNNTISMKWKNQERKITSHFQTTTVLIERIGTLIHMKTEPNPIAIKPIIDKDLFKVSSDDLLTIGALSESLEEACIHKLVLNDQIIGLWNFVKSTGNCPGCQKDTNITGNVLFNGNGYRNVTGAKTVSPKSFNFQFYLTTFDENSLIFLAQDRENPCSYILLRLEEGHVKLNVRHVDGTNVTLTSNDTVNNGRETRVEIGFYYQDNTQLYSLVTEGGKITAAKQLKISSVFKIKKSQIFIGGIPNTFDKSCLLVNIVPFLGYLRPGNAEYSDPVRTMSYNTKLQTGELQFNKVWFTGRGFLKLLTVKQYGFPLDLSFLLRPENSNAFIVNIKNLADFYIKNDKFVIQLENVTHILDVQLNRDVNFINVIFYEDLISVTVNNYNKDIQYSVVLPSGQIELYLGNDRHGEQPNYSGGISNIVINNSTIMFNIETIKGFDKVEIGRERPLLSVNNQKNSLSSFIENNSIKDMQNTEGCPLVANYETDPNAVKFGDKPQSFIYIENNFWKKDYNLEFQFRTFYPNGILFLALGNSQHYNLLEVREGKVYLKIKGKRPKTINMQEKVNDGVWHNIQIKQSQIGMKRKRKLTITLDNSIKKPIRIPKNNVRGELYVGGIPVNFTDYTELKDKLHPFRGCMRLFKINNALQVLLKNKKNIVYNNIGQCFPNIEKGAYFSGDAYAVYKSGFKVSKILELSLEFRTVEQNGILLSVSNFGNSPALSVELQGGAVVMTIDMGNGAISNVTNSLNSDFTLCDNRWHNITALYSSSELTVNVDGIRKSWVQSDDNSLMDEIEAPLYVGGLSDNAPSGTLKIKENFKGCIRKLKIEDKLMDWTDMEELNNVLLNSCPVTVV